MTVFDDTLSRVGQQMCRPTKKPVNRIQMKAQENVKFLSEWCRISVVVCLSTSGILLLLSLVATARIFLDISQFYDHGMEEIKEFREIANNAWDGMQTMAPRRERSVKDRFVNGDENKTKRKRQGGYGVSDFTRLKQHFDDNAYSGSSTGGGQCGCAAQPPSCPPGPPGPPGQPGIPGDPGSMGEPGKPGMPGMGITDAYETPGCIVCPAGPSGPSGSPGSLGPPGMPGQPGGPGQPGRPGQAGRLGPPGDAGYPGERGRPGMPGQPGRDARSGKGAPGPKGQPGQMGRPGSMGRPGEPGGMGNPGPAGPQGPPGNRGYNGTPGSPGMPGRNGPPGQDAQYCPCPPKSNEPHPSALEPIGNVDSSFGMFDNGVMESREEYRRKVVARLLKKKKKFL